MALDKTNIARARESIHSKSSKLMIVDNPHATKLCLIHSGFLAFLPEKDTKMLPQRGRMERDSCKTTKGAPIVNMFTYRRTYGHRTAYTVCCCNSFFSPSVKDPRLCKHTWDGHTAAMQRGPCWGNNTGLPSWPLCLTDPTVTQWPP